MTATNRVLKFGAIAAACAQLSSCSDTAEPLAHAEGTLGSPAFALVRNTFPSPENPGPPAYARIDHVPPHVYSDGTLVAVVFYRDPACVPLDFNLLAFFDAPAAFGCTLLVEGAALWNGAPSSEPPAMSKAHGHAVPVWFAPAGAVQAAMSDGQLTIVELAGLDGLLMGTADRFHEMLQPAGGPQGWKLVLEAHGELDDGRRFAFQLAAVEGDIKAIRIAIR